MPAAIRLKASASYDRFSTMFGPIQAMAKNASTMLGMPASTSRIGFSTRRTRSLAYSARYTAAARPTGIAITMPTAVTMSDPANNVRRS